jgi:ATP-dependent DNA helicase RecG
MRRKFSQTVDETGAERYILNMDVGYLDAVLAEGEGQRVEFKERPSGLSREICAFANSGGGSLYIGVTDDGSIAERKVTNRLLSEIQDAARNCDPPAAVKLVRHGTHVVQAIVEDGKDKPYRCRDGFFIRAGANSQKLKRDEIRALITETGRFHFDESPSRGFRFPQDYDDGKLEEFLRLSGVTSPLQAQGALEALDVLRREDNELRMTQAGVLFFAKEPQKWLKESYVTCVRYAGTDRFEVLDRQDIMGTPFAMIEGALNFVRRNIRVEHHIDGNARRADLHEYPQVAVREAITNAVMHRDYYYDLSHVYVNIFADRLEVENPGGLPGGLTLEDLGERSVRRNRQVADLLHRARYVERIGSGIHRMRQSLAENGNPPFEVTSGQFFLIRFLPRPPVPPKESLTSRQARLMGAIGERGSITKRTASELLGVSGDTVLREINGLVARRLVTKEGNGKSTRYTLGKDRTGAT